MYAAGTNMNCDQYKEAIAADPSESFDGGALHSAECSSCNAFKAEMQALDVRIAAAFAIDVPDLNMPELPLITSEDKVVDLASRRPIRWTTPAWVGLAASVVHLHRARNKLNDEIGEGAAACTPQEKI